MVRVLFFFLSFSYGVYACASFLPPFIGMAPTRLTIPAFSGGGVMLGAHIRIFEEIVHRSYNFFGDTPPVYDLFDGMAGKSAGSLLAASLITPLPSKKRPIFLEEAPDVLGEFLSIFKPSTKHFIRSTGGVLGPKFEIDLLELKLKELFGNKCLSDTKIPFKANFYDMASDLSVAPDTFDTKNYPLYKLIAASCCAPVAFNPYKERFLDGGLAGEAAVDLALELGLKHDNVKTIDILDIRAPRNKIQPQGGLYQWVKRRRFLQIIKKAGNADQVRQATEGAFRNASGDKVKVSVHTFQPYLPDDVMPRLDDLSNKAMKAYEQSAFNLIEERPDLFDRVAKIIAYQALLTRTS